jgi:hypothetical protein
MRWRPVFVLALTAGIAVPAATSAQDGSRPDPDSPAGVEYQLPLDRAREEAAGRERDRRRGTGEGGGSAPLFGAGIEPPDEVGEGREPAGGEGLSSGGDDDGDGRDGIEGESLARDESGSGDGIRPSREGGSPEDPPGAQSSSAAEGGGSGTPVTVGIALGVLLLGAGLGLALRRGFGRAGT